jgi:hypothetical protein
MKEKVIAISNKRRNHRWRSPTFAPHQSPQLSFLFWGVDSERAKDWNRRGFFFLFFEKPTTSDSTLDHRSAFSRHVFYFSFHFGG